jgi:hypothetical protein
MSTDDVQADIQQLAENTNEEALADDFEAHRLASNTNEEGLAADAEVEPSRLSSNTNEELLADSETEEHGAPD